MRRVLIVLGAALVTGCPTPAALCRKGVDQVCEREFECQPQAVKDSAPFQAAFGTSEQECKDLLYVNPLRPTGAQGIACGDMNNDSQLCANLGVNATSFDLSKASDCKEARAKLECSAFLAQVNPNAPGGQPPPAACSERCKNVP